MGRKPVLIFLSGCRAEWHWAVGGVVAGGGGAGGGVARAGWGGRLEWERAAPGWERPAVWLIVSRVR